MDIFGEIQTLAISTSNAFIQKAKEDGKKIMGYMCSYIPEEIIHAAGFVPYRIKAVESKGTSKGDTFYSPKNCTYVRHCFDKAIRGDFDFLDGVIFMNGCDHSRRMYDNWCFAKKNKQLDTDFLYMFVAPHIIGVNAMAQYIEEINKFKRTIEQHFNIVIDDESIMKSIKLYNKKRRLLEKIYEKRKRPEVPVKGSEMLSTMLAITSIPVEDANELLARLDTDLESRVVSTNDLRILIAGGCIEEIEHIRMIEDEGSIIVADSLCLGQRHFDLEVSEADEPLVAIANRYLNHLSCPRMIDDFQRRLDFFTDSIKNYNLDAIIIEKLLFCSLWGGENYLLKNEIKSAGFPVLALERELYGGEASQLRTRIQAFFEQIRN